MGVEYSAVAAKLRAMYSKALMKDDYEELLSKKSVNDICSYLKMTDGYKEVLSDVNERDIHRGEMELLLEQELMDEYVRLYNFVENDKREILKFWFMRHEVEFLKREASYIYTHEERRTDEVNRSKFDAFFETHTSINREIMDKAASIDDCIKACEGTPYSEALLRAQNLGADFFSMGMLLDSDYYTSVWRSTKRRLKGEQLELFQKMTGSKIDMLNLMWIYRGKKYFQFENEIIFTYLLPIRYRLTEDVIKQLVNTDSVERFIQDMEKETPYGILFKDCGGGKFPEENFRLLHYRMSKNIFVNHSESMAAIFAYLYLKEFELNNITTIIEGIRYSLNADYIRSHVGM